MLMLECAPHAFRGGNSRHTRNLRYAHSRADGVMTGPYLEDECFEDLLKVTKGRTNEALAKFTIKHSLDCGEWMTKHGVRFQPPLEGTLHLGRTNAFFLGGGKALVNAYYRTAARLGVEVAYEAEVRDLEVRDGRFISAVVFAGGREHRVKGRAVVAAAGGFEANVEWLKESWGPAADNFIIRGTPYNKGRVLRVLLDRGARQIGDPRQCHAVAVDGRAPKFDGGIVTRVDCVAFGIVVNTRGERFYDEGEDFWPKRYAIWGRLVAQQPDQIGHVIIDSKPVGKFMPTVFPPVIAGTVRELAAKLRLDPDKLDATVREFNRAVRPGAFDPTTLDDCRTEGIVPPKTHWGVALDTPPFRAYSLRPGITFTYLGLQVDEKARIVMADGSTSSNMFAAGEIMAGNVLGQGYMAGFGMTIGTVFGRIAGEQAGAMATRRGTSTDARMEELVVTPAETLSEAERILTICNACRYCEGHCATMRAMERRLSFTEQDLRYLAVLCHDCGSCFYHCQYAPPHEFNVNVPRVLGELRQHVYRRHTWPGVLGAAFVRNGLFTGLVTATACVLLVVAGAESTGSAALQAHVGAGAFYRVVPHWTMNLIFGTAFGFAILALAMAVRSFWRDAGEPGDVVDGKKILAATRDVATLRYLDGGGDGCTYPTEAPSMARRWFHHLTFYGFVLCFAATISAAAYELLLGRPSPFPFFSLPVVLGTLGGVGLVVGPVGLLVIKARADDLPYPRTGMDVSFLILLLLTSVTGLLVFAFRETSAMGILLLAHLGAVLGVFLAIPYGKFIHSGHRYAVLVRYEIERSRPPPHSPEA